MRVLSVALLVIVVLSNADQGDAIIDTLKKAHNDVVQKVGQEAFIKVIETAKETFCDKSTEIGIQAAKLFSGNKCEDSGDKEYCKFIGNGEMIYMVLCGFAGDHFTLAAKNAVKCGLIMDHKSDASKTCWHEFYDQIKSFEEFPKLVQSVG